MLTYCVKQKKQTACVPGSETFVVTKNGRNAMKCQCAECGATKFRFINRQSREGLGDILGTFTGGLMKSGTDQLQKVYNTAPQYQLLLRSLSEAATLFLTDRVIDRVGPGRFIIWDLSRSDFFRWR